MALADTILLQISSKKNNYNDLLTKMVSNYSSLNSAKAALSRALKNLIAFGQIERVNDYYVLTEKGHHTIESKFKNTVVLKINQLLEISKKKSSLEHVDEIVKNLQIFLERSKEDPTLLKTGKTTSNFYIKDLEVLRREIDTSLSHYTYNLSVLSKHIKLLQEANFEDYIILNLSKNTLDVFHFWVLENNFEEILFDCSNQYPQTLKFFENNSFFTKKTEVSFRLNLNDFDAFRGVLLNDFEVSLSIRFRVYLNDVMVRFSFGKVYFFGPYNSIKKISTKAEELNLL